MSDKLFHPVGQDAGESTDERASAKLRSGTAARLADVPVTTLRVWERRYGVVAGVKSPNGQRLYSPHDVMRLKLLRQLTHSGHAIGTIATLELDALQALASAEASVATAAGSASTSTSTSTSGGAGATADAHVPHAAPLRRIVVVGAAAAHRVAALAGCVLLARHADLAQAQRGAAAELEAHGAVDVLLVQLASLQAAAVDAILMLAATLQAETTVLLYTFGTQASVQALRDAGVMVQREPVSLAALSQWLQPARPGTARAPGEAANGAADPGGAGGNAAGPVERRAGNTGWAIEPQRFSEAELAELTDPAGVEAREARHNAAASAHAAPVVRCECMRHIAEIVVQLAAFERYSAECASTSPSDAALHRQLHAITGAARTRFEQALQRVVSIEGVALGGRPGVETWP